MKRGNKIKSTVNDLDMKVGDHMWLENKNIHSN